jgi:hypothetical protein
MLKFWLIRGELQSLPDFLHPLLKMGVPSGILRNLNCFLIFLLKITDEITGNY